MSAPLGDDFAPVDVDMVRWGSLTLHLTDEASGHVFWDSVLEGYGSGDYPLQRLARPQLAHCIR